MNDPSPRDLWSIPADVTYLHHGAFGPTPRVVQDVREAWSGRLAAEPMDFYVRRMEGELDAAKERLGAFVGMKPANFTFVDNATFAMNVVAATLPLEPGDEVLLTDHEYGAVQRTWRKRCEATGARITTARLPQPLGDSVGVVEAIFAAVTERTKLLVVSHVTSPTALVLPVAEICAEARRRGVPVAVDGPHAIAMQPLDVESLGCDFYCASLHKWLSAPLGSGFLWVSRRWQDGIVSPITSWGGSLAGRPPRWQDDFNWLGSRDPAAFLSVPAAIDFLAEQGVERFREHGHALAEYALERLTRAEAAPPLFGDDHELFGTLVGVPLPDADEEKPKGADQDPLQVALWEKHRIEVPIVHWGGQRFVRVSCHLYNTREDVDRLAGALGELL